MMSDKDTKNSMFNHISSSQLFELRKAIIGLDQQELQRLSDLVQDPELFAQEISQLLPLSIKKMFDRGDIDLDYLRDLIERVLTQSVKNNPKALANILFPIMMPAIRKAVSEDLKLMIDSLNTSMEHSFSPKRIGWRFQALFSGRKYAEIVLSNAYVYKVNQVFLIHKSTGLLLNQVYDDELKNTGEADMISSMLSAIKDFVQDSFKRDKEEQLDTIKVGSFNIWIEQGPHALIAAIVEGNAPGDLRLTLKEALEAIHVNFGYELAHFKGDTEVFESKDRFLQSCMLKEKKEVKRKRPILLMVFGLMLLGALGFWTYLQIESGIRFNKLVHALDEMKGVIVVEAEKEHGVYVVKGLYDPLVGSLTPLLATFDFNANEVNLKFERVISLEYDMILHRAFQKLTPPSTIQLSLHYDTLLASGMATQEWIEHAIIQVVGLPGITHFDSTGVQLSSVKEPIVITEEKAIQKSILAIEKFYFVFGFDKSEMDSLQKIDFNLLVGEVKSVLDFRFDQDSVPVIEVVSHTSYTGNPAANSSIAQKRADQFVDFMVEAKIPVEVLVPKVVFVEDQVDMFPVRSVSFKVKYVNPVSL